MAIQLNSVKFTREVARVVAPLLTRAVLRLVASLLTRGVARVAHPLLTREVARVVAPLLTRASPLLTRDVVRPPRLQSVREAVLGQTSEVAVDVSLGRVGAGPGHLEARQVLLAARQRVVRRAVPPVAVDLAVREVLGAGTGVVGVAADARPEPEGGSAQVDAARVVEPLSDEPRQPVARPRAAVHGGDGAPRPRVVVDHDDGRRTARLSENVTSRHRAGVRDTQADWIHGQTGHTSILDQLANYGHMDTQTNCTYEHRLLDTRAYWT